MTGTGGPTDATLESSTQSVAAGSMRLLVSRIAASAATFLAFLVLARSLVPADRGAVAFVMTLGLVLAVLSSLGLDNATVVFASKWEGLRSVLLTNLYLITLAAAALLGTASAVALALFPAARPAGVGGAELASLVVGTVGLRAFSANIAFLLGCSLFRLQAVAFAASPVILGCLLAVAWLAHDVDVGVACGLWASAQVMGALAGAVLVLRVQVPGRASLSVARDSVAFGLRAWAGTVAGLLNARIDQVIMGLISTEAALGVYAVAANASEVALYVPAAVALAIIPTVARGAGEERIEMTLRVFRALLLVAAGIVAIGLVCAPLIPVIFGDDYRASIEPFVLLLPGAIPYVALSVFTGSLAASLAPGRSSIGPITALAVGVVLDLILIPSFGANGAAVAATAAFTVGGLAAAATYVGLTGVSIRALVPRRDDLRMIRGLARRTVGLPPE